MKPKITALLIMAGDRRLPLLVMLDDCGIEVFPASDRTEAHRILGTRHPVQVVLTDATLPDGSWLGVLEDVVQSRVPAEVIVCARVADARLWCDVLQRGVYDLLVEPYQRDEVRRIVEAAAARSSMRSLLPGKALRDFPSL